jgi:hypothetical protein
MSMPNQSHRTEHMNILLVSKVCVVVLCMKKPTFAIVPVVRTRKAKAQASSIFELGLYRVIGGGTGKAQPCDLHQAQASFLPRGLNLHTTYVMRTTGLARTALQGKPPGVQP